MYNVIFLGAPGAGKGTQAAIVAKKTGYAHIASGDMFRQAIERADDLGRKVKTYLEQGKLVPDEITVQMVLGHMVELKSSGYILDGFPRTLGQAEALASALGADGEKIGRVIYIKVPEAELVERLSGRWVCRSCQATYSYALPELVESCNKCDGELYQRPDDKPETVKKRLKVYFNDTAPLIEYYTKQGILAEVDGVGGIQEITARIIHAIGAPAR